MALLSVKRLDKWLANLKVHHLLLVSAGLIILISMVATAGRLLVMEDAGRWGLRDKLWGFTQTSSVGAVCQTVRDLDEIESRAPDKTYALWTVMGISILAWLFGMVIFGLATATVVNRLREHQQDIRSGRVRYKFSNHGVIVGWDFQGVASVMALLGKDLFDCHEVVILSEGFSDRIRNELDNEIDAETMKRIFIYNGSVGVEDDLRFIWAEAAKTVIILGDQNDSNNDGGNMCIARKIRRHVHGHRKPALPPLQVLVDVTNGYNFRFYELFPTEGDEPESDVCVRVMNFCKASVADLYSSFTQFSAYIGHQSEDRYAPGYCPLAFRRNPEANHVHIIFSDLTEMSQAAIVHLIPILGTKFTDARGHSEKNRITVFYDHDDELVEDEKIKFCNAYPLLAEALKGDDVPLQNVVVEFERRDICARESRDLLAQIAQDVTASVTLFVVNACPDAALEKFNLLPEELRYENVRVVVEQRMLSKWAPSIRTLNSTGFSKVDFFGFTDRYYASFSNAGKMLGHVKREIAETSRLTIYRESILFGALELLSSMDATLKFNPKGLPNGVKLESAEDFGARILQSEHNRNVNYKLLSGVRHAMVSDVFANVSEFLVPWEQVDARRRETYVTRLREVFSAVGKVFDGSDSGLPFGIFPQRFRCVLGILPTEDWCAKGLDEQVRFRRVLQGRLLGPFVEDSRSFVCGNGARASRPAKKLVLQPSVAVLIVPGRGVSYDVARMLYDMGVPMILVLNKEPSAYRDYFKTDYTKALFDRLVRIAFTYCVVPVETREELNAFICSHSDEVFGCEMDASELAPERREVSIENKWIPSRTPRIRHVLRVRESNGRRDFEIVSTRMDGAGGELDLNGCRDLRIAGE